MKDNAHKIRDVPTQAAHNPNISTENQPEGAARRASDTLDREPDREPISAGAIPSDDDPVAATRHHEKNDTSTGQDEAGAKSHRSQR